jgi:hypothetical protein
VLTFAQSVEQHDLSVGKLKRVVMFVWIVDVNLSEPSNLPRDLSVREKGMTILNHILFEGDLRARKQAHCHGRLFCCGKSARDGVLEFRRYQLLSDLCRSGRE